MKRGSVNCDELWRIWYVILNTILHGFLLYVGLTRYLSFKTLVFDPKYGDNWSHFGLNFYLGLTISALVSFFFFLYACLTKTNNFANEGVQIGRDTDNLMFLLNEDLVNCQDHEMDPRFSHGGDVDRSSKHENFFISDTINNNTWNNKQYSWKKPATLKSNMKVLFKRFKRNFLPYSSLLHVVIAFCLYLPLPVFEAQQIHHRAISENHLWNNDLSLIFRHDLNRDMGIFGSSVSQPEKGGESKKLIFTDDSAMSFRAPSTATTTTTTTTKITTEQLIMNIISSPSPITPRAMSPEFFNIIFALLLLCMRYPAVFWYTNKIFAFFFAVLLIASSLQVILELCVVSVLVKMAINSNIIDINRRRGQEMKDTLAKILESQHTLKSENISIGSLSYLLLSVFGSLLMLIAFYTIFEYGNRQFSANMMAYRQYLTTQGGNMDTFNTLMGHPKVEVQTGPCSCCFHVYTPHIFAMILSIFIILVKTPIFLASLEIYRHTGSYLMLSGMMATCFYLFLWLTAWFAFRLKPAWQFKVNLPVQSTGPMDGGGELGGQYDPALMQLSSSTLPRMSRISFARQNSISGGISNFGSSYLPNMFQMPQSQSGSLSRGGHQFSMVHDGIVNGGRPVYSCYHDETMKKKMKMVRHSDSLYVPDKEEIYLANKDPIDTFKASRFLSNESNGRNVYFPGQSAEVNDDVYTKHHFQQTIHPLSTNLINQNSSITGSGSNASSSLVTAVPNTSTTGRVMSQDDADLFLGQSSLSGPGGGGEVDHQSYGPSLSVYRPHNLSLSNTSVIISDTNNFFERVNPGGHLQLSSNGHNSFNGKKASQIKRTPITGTQQQQQQQDCSPNSSEPGSHNTISSDSGIDNKKNKNNETFTLAERSNDTDQAFIGLTDEYSNEIPPPLKLLEKTYGAKSIEDVSSRGDTNTKLYSQV